MAVVRSLLIGAWERLLRPEITVGTWILLVMTSVAPALFGRSEESMSNVANPVIQSLAIPGGILLVGLMFWVLWTLTRQCSDVRDRRGAFWPWIGWSLAAYLPGIFVLLVLGISGVVNFEESFLGESLLLTLSIVIAAPWFVHASGRAIIAAGPTISEIWSNWRQDYAALATAFALVAAPFGFLSDMVYVLADESLLTDIIATLVYFPATLLMTTLSVEAFHRVPYTAKA